MTAKDNQDFLPAVCKIKHEKIDLAIEGIKEKINDIEEDGQLKQGELKELINKLSQDAKENHENLKKKIILSEKRTGDKIDALNSFDDTLKGNGNPGIWETVRNIKRNGKTIIVIGIILIVLMLGGDYKGISLNKLKQRLGIKKTEIKKVELKVKPKKELTIKLLPKPIFVPK